MLAKNLENLLHDKEISVSELSRRTEIPKTNILSWKNGGNPKIEQLLKLAQYFNVTVDYLLTGKHPDEFDIDGLFSKVEIHSGTYELTIKKVTKR
jgi:transcriptional regulator with XRE-family HTH domain